MWVMILIFVYLAVAELYPLGRFASSCGKRWFFWSQNLYIIGLSRDYGLFSNFNHLLLIFILHSILFVATRPWPGNITLNPPAMLRSCNDIIEKFSLFFYLKHTNIVIETWSQTGTIMVVPPTILLDLMMKLQNTEEILVNSGWAIPNVQ